MVHSEQQQVGKMVMIMIILWFLMIIMIIVVMLLSKTIRTFDHDLTRGGKQLSALASSQPRLEAILTTRSSRNLSPLLQVKTSEIQHNQYFVYEIDQIM